jgi:hypothetical protein
MYIFASEISFTGTPPYNIVLKDAGGGTETRTESSPYAVPPGLTVQSFTDKTGAPGKLSCMPSTPYNLTVSATAYCAGSSVTFALSNTMPGQTYWLYKGSDHVNTLTGTGSAATFTGTFAGAGVYTAQTIADMGYCPATMNGSLPVVYNPLPTAPAMSGGGSHCGGTMDITATPGSDGNGIRWTDGSSTTATRSVGTGTYYAVTTSAAGCESGTASVEVSERLPGALGQPPDAVCGCTCGSYPKSYAGVPTCEVAFAPGYSPAGLLCIYYFGCSTETWGGIAAEDAAAASADANACAALAVKYGFEHSMFGTETYGGGSRRVCHLCHYSDHDM